MRIHSRIRRICNSPSQQAGMCAVLMLGLAVLAACGADDPGDGDRSNRPATRASSCEHPATTHLAVRVVDKAEAPVAGVLVTLAIDGDRAGGVATTDGRGVASFDAVASCASVGIWVSRGGSDLGFVQVRLQPGGTDYLTVRIRR